MTFPLDPTERGPEGLGPPPGVFRFRPRRRRFSPPGGLVRWGTVLVALILLYAVASIAKGIYANWLWFDSVEYTSVYRLRIVTRIWLFFAGSGVFLAYFGSNVLFALRAGSSEPDNSEPAFALADPAAVRRIALVAGIALTLFVAVIFGVQAAGQWDSILLYINSQPFGVQDPAFHKDIGFYVFELPALNFIVGWSLGVAVLTTLAVAALYAFRTLAAGFEITASRWARPHVSLLLVAVIALFIWRYWLGRYALVYSDRGAVFGATYTDIHAQLPVVYALMALAAITAVCVLAGAVRRSSLWLPGGAVAIWVVAAITGGVIYPASFQRFQVEPNELDKERPYIEDNIAATRAAFALDTIDERPFPARASVTNEELVANPQTTTNIRLWDFRPLLQTLNQLQAIRLLYSFLNVDVDRYIIEGQVRQVMLAARELDPGKLPEDRRSWVNRRLEYTHGFGIAMSAVNEVVREGLPEFFVQDIPPTGVIDITQPRIYYGELTDQYVVVGGDSDEFDYPIGTDQQARSRFDGGGGVKIDSFLRRFVFSWELADTNLLISDALGSDSRLLYRRNIHDRVAEIAPFLDYDADPYLVVADDGRLYWMQDAYTSTDRYPYATRSDAGINYIRNSVKIVIDAYDGSVTYYLIDPTDPIARVYDKIYPDLFTPFEQMPDSLRAHIRYPEGLFQIQAEMYRRYHVQDPRVLYNGEDLWDIPTELFYSQEQPVLPYYVIMRLPGEQEEEFILILPLRPGGERKNTVALIAARSDGANYGELIAFRFPTDSLIFGPSQVESRIDQDPVISSQISLWNQSGSQVIRGNMLMIPIGEGTLFVEPIYLQATASSLPELKRVIVVNGSTIAMEPTLDRALNVILGRAAPSGPTTSETPVAPTPGPTATEGETPQPTSSPQPTVVPSDDVGALVQQANESFARAQQLLRQGDFAGYGEEVSRLEGILQRLMELSGDQSQ
ncbi:MAG: UPF0182 family protein [Dehalococcoidia bacterium]